MAKFEPKHVCDYPFRTPNVCIGCAYEEGIEAGYDQGYIDGVRDTHDEATHQVVELIEEFHARDGELREVPLR